MVSSGSPVRLPAMVTWVSGTVVPSSGLVPEARPVRRASRRRRWAGRPAPGRPGSPARAGRLRPGRRGLGSGSRARGRTPSRHLLPEFGGGIGMGGPFQGCACQAQLGHHPAGWPALALVPPARSVVAKGLVVDRTGVPGPTYRRGRCEAPPHSPAEVKPKEEFGSRLFAEWIRLPPQAAPCREESVDELRRRLTEADEAVRRLSDRSAGPAGSRGVPSRQRSVQADPPQRVRGAFAPGCRRGQGAVRAI